MVLDSFTSKNGDRYTLESKGGTYYICINGRTDSYSSDESTMRRKFAETKSLIGK
jgi:hypothetical protein